MGTLKRPPTPQDIIDLGQFNTCIRAHLALWARGQITWEQALMGMVVGLREQLDKATHLAFDAEMFQPRVISFTDAERMLRPLSEDDLARMRLGQFPPAPKTPTRQ